MKTHWTAHALVALGTLIPGVFSEAVAFPRIIPDGADNTYSLWVLLLFCGRHWVAEVCPFQPFRWVSHSAPEHWRRFSLTCHLLCQLSGELELRFLCSRVSFLIDDVALYFCQMNKVKCQSLPAFPGLANKIVISKVLVELIHTVHVLVAEMHGLWLDDSVVVSILLSSVDHLAGTASRPT